MKYGEYAVIYGGGNLISTAKSDVQVKWLTPLLFMINIISRNYYSGFRKLSLKSFFLTVIWNIL